MVLTVRKGGYNLDSISNSALAVAKVILGDPPPRLPPMTASADGMETIWHVAMEQSKYWKGISPKACEPRESEFLCIYLAELLNHLCVAIPAKTIPVNGESAFCNLNTLPYRFQQISSSSTVWISCFPNLT
jgi:hypothetical protein